MRVCYFGTYRQEYARNRILIDGLRRVGIEVVECHEPLWRGEEDRLQTAEGGWSSPRFWGRVITAYTRLARRYAETAGCDVLIAGYPGHFDIFLAKAVSLIRKKPLVWDTLNSLYLILVDRGIARRRPFTTSLVRSLERLACRLPDRLILDTPIFIDWFAKTYQISKDHFRLVPIGADDALFRQVGALPRTSPQVSDRSFQVLYFGTYIPNHGVTTIVEAAYLLTSHPDIHFTLVGKGPERQTAGKLVEFYQLDNLTFVDWMEIPDLVNQILAADLCLGSFGDTLQARLTNNNKIYEAFILGRPVISGASPALPAVLKHQEHLFICERANAQSLAEGILSLKGNPELRQRLGVNGQRVFWEYFDVTHIGQAFAAILHECVDNSQPLPS